MLQRGRVCLDLGPGVSLGQVFCGVLPFPVWEVEQQLPCRTDALGDAHAFG